MVCSRNRESTVARGSGKGGGDGCWRMLGRLVVDRSHGAFILGAGESLQHSKQGSDVIQVCFCKRSVWTVLVRMGRNSGGQEAWEVAALSRQGWVGAGAGVDQRDLG